MTENIQHVAQKAERLGLSFTNVKLGKTGFKVTSEQGDSVNSDKSKNFFHVEVAEGQVTFKVTVSSKSTPILISLPS